MPPDRPPSTPPPRYNGDFVAWTGGCALIGEGRGAIALHAHYAIQLSIAPSALRLRVGRSGTWQSCAGALIPSRAVHSIDVDDCEWSSVVFIEPETAAGRAMAARLQGKPQMLPPDLLAPFVARLASAWRIERDAQAVQSVYQRLVATVSGQEPREPSDPRVLEAVAWIRGRAGEPITLEDVARVAHLSPSRFRHLFVQQTGMPLRSYLQWRRLLHVWRLLTEGRSLSSAAHEAGFADSAHLSRTARTMFGLPPSALQMSGPLSAGVRAARLHFA